LKPGRKATPKVLAGLHGRPHHKKAEAEAPDGVGDLWAPPVWMTDEQRDEWIYAVEHSPPGLLSGTDREALAAFCVHAVEFVRAARQYATEPLTYKSDTGVIHANPLGVALTRHTAMMIRAIDQLGFSPASRAALGRSGPEFSNAPAQIGQPRANPRLAAYLDAKPDKANQGDAA
jgi:P27 family predicted phage terminase small subunit